MLRLAVFLVMIVACVACIGGPSTVRGEVTSVDDDRVCIDDEWTGQECLGPQIPGTDGLKVGDCIDVRHEGESADILEVSPCADDTG